MDMKLEEQDKMKYPNKITKSLKTISLERLPGYKDYKEANLDWTIGSYLNMKYNILDAISFFKLYFPNFIQYKDCIFLEDRFNSEIVDNWLQEFNDDLKRVEYMSNLYEVKDLFHINWLEDVSSFDIKELGDILQFSWQLNLDKLFGENIYQVDCFEEEEIYITISRK